jgi:hypothetical protein
MNRQAEPLAERTAPDSAMAVPMRRSPWRTLARSGVAAVLLVAVAACSSDGDDASSSNDLADQSTDVADSGVSSDSEAGGDGGQSVEDDASNPVVFGYEVDGPSGTTVVVVSTVVADDVEQSPISATWSITDRPREQIFTPFIDAGELELEVTEGGPATVTVIRARYVDPEDPFAGIDVVERLDSVEVAAGATEVIAFP